MKIQQNIQTIYQQNFTSPQQQTKEKKAHFTQQDVIKLSAPSKMMGKQLSLDKGTAAHTTLYVDRATFQKISTYTTNHPDNKWSELGIDGEKRWIVVNGQRFESPLSEEEKEMRRRGQMTLVDHIEEVEQRKKEEEKKKKITLDFTNPDAPIQSTNHPKLVALQNNEKVMSMLKDISKGSFGQITLSLTSSTIP